jgi:hypothetical protein
VYCCGLSPNPQAAVAAADLTDNAALGAAPLTGGVAGLSAAIPAVGSAAFAAAYGAEDARAVAVQRGETEFLYRHAVERSSSEEEEEEEAGVAS